MNLELLILMPGRQKFRHAVGERSSVAGRSAKCDIVLPDVKVSSRHAVFATDVNGRLVIEDLGSRNGTFVNGTRVETRALDLNDRVAIGDTVVVVVHPEGQENTTRDELLGVHRGRHSLSMDMDRVDQELVEQRAEDEEDQTARTLWVVDVRDVLAPVVAFRPFLDRLGAVIYQAIGPDRVGIYRLEGSSLQPLIQLDARGRGSPPEGVFANPYVTGQAVEKKRVFLCMDPVHDTEFGAAGCAGSEGVASAMAAPLRVGDGVRGVLYADRFDAKKGFTARHLRFLGLIAAQAGELMERRRYLEGERLGSRPAQSSPGDDTRDEPNPLLGPRAGSMDTKDVAGPSAPAPSPEAIPTEPSPQDAEQHREAPGTAVPQELMETLKPLLQRLLLQIQGVREAGVAEGAAWLPKADQVRESVLELWRTIMEALEQEDGGP